ncbi:SPFH domain-containing protein [bacterium]|nr:SPFH domain-containing protein [bacterium]
MAIEVIQWKEDTGEDMVWRFPGSDEIKMGAQLIVSESQAAVFFRDGKALDVFTAGRHTLSTMNLPLLTKLMSWPFGFKSPFQAEVYFVSRRIFTNQKWGTREPVVFRDTEFKMVRLRSFGVFSMRVHEPQLFVNTVVGTQQRFTTGDVEGFLRDIIVSRLNDVLGETLKTLLDLPRYYDELGVALKTRVKEDFGRYGLELVDFYINSITPPEDVQKVIDERSGMAAVGDMNQYMRYKAARAVGDAAKQEGGSAGEGMGLGMGAGLGMMLPGMISQAMQGAEQGTIAAGTIPCPSCQAQIPSGSQFCSSCGAKVLATMHCPKCNTQIPAGSKFCSGCGASLATTSCAKCGTALAPGAKFCSNCGEASK